MPTLTPMQRAGARTELAAVAINDDLTILLNALEPRAMIPDRARLNQMLNAVERCAELAQKLLDYAWEMKRP